MKRTHLAIMLKLMHTPRVFLQIARNRIMTKRAYSHQMVSTRKLQTLVFITTRLCNLRCEMCFQAHNDHKKREENRIGIDDYRKVLDEVKDWKPVIQINGGEPFMYPDMPLLLEEIKKRNLFCMINTNGTLLKKHAELIVKLGVEKLAISVEGPPELHNKICNFDKAYNMTLAGIQAIAEEKKRQKSAYPMIHVKSVISPANVGQLEPVIKLYDTGWIQMVEFSNMWFLHESQVELHDKLHTGVDYHPPSTFPLFSKDDFRTAMEHVWDLQRRYDHLPFIVYPYVSEDLVDIYYEKPTKFLHKNHCLYPYQSARILPDGDVHACFEDLAAKAIIGNVRENSLTEIIRGEKAQEFLRKLDEAGGAWPICTRCCGIFRT